MSASDPNGRPDDHRSTQTTALKATEWLLLTGDRRLVALGIAVLLTAFFGSLAVIEGVPLTNVEVMSRLYQALLVGNVTLITVIVSINQLLLTRELQSPGELRSQIEEIIDYRSEVEDALDEVAPVQPLGFLRGLVDATREQAKRLSDEVSDDGTSDGRENVEAVTDELVEQMDQLDTLLTESGTGTFSVLSVMLETNYATQINRLRRLHAEHEAEFSDDVHDSVDDLVDRLQEIDVARQYFKSIYLQQELASLSRALLYTGFPAIATTTGVQLLLTVPSGPPGPPVPIELLVPVTLAICLTPLAILGAVILRTATVTKLTAATLPFTTPEQERWF